MRIREVFDFDEDDEVASDMQLQHAVDNIILRLKQGNIEEVGLDDFAGEVSKTVSSDIYVNVRDPEFRNTLIQKLEDNDSVQDVSNDKIVIKREGEFNASPDMGAEAAAKRKQQTAKVAKNAMSDLKQKSKTGEL